MTDVAIMTICFATYFIISKVADLITSIVNIKSSAELQKLELQKPKNEEEDGFRQIGFNMIEVEEEEE